MFSMQSLATFAFSAAFALVTLPTAQAEEPLAESHFDGDTEGWTVTGASEGALVHAPDYFVNAAAAACNGELYFSLNDSGFGLNDRSYSIELIAADRDGVVTLYHPIDAPDGWTDYAIEMGGSGWSFANGDPATSADVCSAMRRLVAFNFAISNGERSLVAFNFAISNGERSLVAFNFAIGNDDDVSERSLVAFNFAIGNDDSGVSLDDVELYAR
jgi:hypothetical protein